MLIAINKAHYPVTVLGPGQRIGIWFQGCRIHCPGCVSQDTWAADPGKRMPLHELVAWCRRVGANGCDGITLSGGEPFDQPQALGALLDALHDWRRSAGLEFDILCYSGYPLKRLRERHAPLLKKLDALIPEPYVDTLPLSHLWRGSQNQPLLPLSARGERIYHDYLDAAADPGSKRLQIEVDGNRLWSIGLPARGDLAALEAQAAERGLRLDHASWKS